ncbi:glycine betaine ABC transporter substrate-binding protein [Sporosarcina jiandibaonis]|uniref:ABC transporter substrate-binding protein n=1 Tax=Sporosarcina jiandibaonis TaxID=2715535 RepID=UPI0015525FBF|nr:glycine betaine ABC transporter substrate-binding protein [Sporosarcina jiandibaonis]
MRKIGVLILVSVILLIAACSNDSGGEGNEKTKIAIGGKNFTEQILLVHLLGTLLEHHTDHDIVLRDGLGTSNVLTQALKDNDIQLFVDYSGTGLINILGLELQEDDTPESVYEKAKNGYEEEYGFTWLDTLGFSNTWTLILREEKAKELNVKTFSDLVPHIPDLIVGSDAQFFERADGYVGMAEKYGMGQFKDHKEMDIGLAFKAIDEGKIDVLVGYATDGRIPALNLVTLEDDKGYFPPYYAAPILRMDFLEKYPEVGEVLNMLSGVIDEKEMSAMNSKMDNDQMDEREIVEEFLLEKGLIKK